MYLNERVAREGDGAVVPQRVQVDCGLCEERLVDGEGHLLLRVIQHCQRAYGPALYPEQRLQRLLVCEA